MRRVTSKRSETFWPRSIVKKLLNLKEDADEYSADEDDENPVYTPKSLRRFSESALSRTHFTYSQDFSVFVGTWNVAGKSPADNMDLKEWLDTSKDIDIYVIGFQEVVPLNPGNVFGAEDEGPATKWETLIRRTLNVDSRQIKSAPSSPWREDADAEEDKCTAETAVEAAEHPGHKKAYSTPDLTFNDDKSGNLPASFTSASSLHPEKRNGKSYIRLISKQMVGIFITVWIRKGLRRYVHDVKVSCVGCGLMGYYGNKGSVSVSMMLDQTSFCFICAHLTSGEKEADELRRNADVEDILRKTSFPRAPGEQCPGRILSHDRLIWLGDLNYRLSLPNGDTKMLVRKENWNAMLEKDQLKVQQGFGGVFYGWREGKIDFPPTYKYKINSVEYSNSGEKQRTPAWCDRVLWSGTGLRLVDYFRTEYTFSDHRPVTAIFIAQAEILKRRGPLEDSVIVTKIQPSLDDSVLKGPWSGLLDATRTRNFDDCTKNTRDTVQEIV